MHDGTYPKHHYWGTDVLLNSKDFNSRFAKSNILHLPGIVSKFINRKIFNGYSDLNNEWNAFHVAKSSDYLYSVCGPLSSIAFYNNCKIISWVFQVNKTNSKNPLDPYHPKNLHKHAGFLCLTPKAEKYYSKFAPSKFIPWCVDLNMFDGKRTELVSSKQFFLASGKTGRDYDTLVNAANYTNAEIRIIGPKNQKPKFIPDNVLWIETSIDPPDQAIDYPTLKNGMHKAPEFAYL